MICSFNGKPFPDKVGMISWTAESPEVKFRTLDLPQRRGMIRAGRKYGERIVRMKLKLWGDSIEENTMLLQLLTEWCMSDGAARLYLPTVPDRYLMAECSKFPAAEVSVLGNDFEVEFTCHQPEWKNTFERTATPGQAFSVLGTLPVPFKIEGRLSAPQLSNAEFKLDGETFLKLDGVFYGGELLIDTERNVVMLDSRDISGRATIESDLDKLLSPGVHTISLPGSTSGIAIRWHDAWI